MHIPIPEWYAAIDLLVYPVATIICFVLASYTRKIYKLSGKRPHMFFYIAFLLLSLGFLIMSVTLNLYHFCGNFCNMQSLNSLNMVKNLGYIMFFVLSIGSYSSFLLAYYSKIEKIKKAFIHIPIIPQSFYTLIWYFWFHLSNLILFVLIAPVVYKVIRIYMKSKERTSYLVVLGFTFLGLYNLMLMSTHIYDVLYPVGHIFLFASFVAFYSMLKKADTP